MLRTLSTFAITLIAFLTTVGLVFHDTKADKAAVIALAVPASVAVYGATDKVMSSMDHVHVERVAMHHRFGADRTPLPRFARRDDADFAWPSA